MATFEDYAAVRPDGRPDVRKRRDQGAQDHTGNRQGVEEGAPHQRQDGGRHRTGSQRHDRIDRTTKRRLDQAIRAGYVTLADVKKGQAFLYITTGTEVAEGLEILRPSTY